MAFDAHANFAYTTVTVAPSPAASGTSLTVSDGTVFPATPFNATIWPTAAFPLKSNAEIVRVTNIVGNVLTIIRTQEGSSARTILVGDQIAETITSKALTDIENAIPSTAGLLSNINLSAGTTSNNLSAATFADSNGISFGLSGSVITGTVATNYQSSGAYLTTAMASNRGTDFVQATAAFAGTSASGTINSTGISVSIGPYLTTAMQSNAATISNVKLSGGTLSSLRSDLTFGDSNGISFGLNTNGVLTGTVATNYQSSGAYLTTAALSQDSSKYAGTSSGTQTTSGTNVVMTINTAGLNLGVPAFLTTAALSGDTSKYAGVSSGTQTTSGTNVVMTHNTAGLNLGVPAFITTAALSGDTSKYAGLGTSVATVAGTDVAIAVNTAGVTVSYPKYITTAALSGDTSKYAGVNGSVATTAGTDLALTLNTSGATIGYPKWITTAMLSNAATISNINVSAGAASANLSNFVLSNSNNISFGLNGSTITATVPSVSVISFSAGTSSQTFGSLVFSNSNGISFGLNGSTVTAQNLFLSYLNIAGTHYGNTVTSSFINSVSYMVPFVVPQNLSVGSVRLYEVGSQAASSTQGLVNGSTLSMSGQTTHNFVFYSRGVGASSMSLQFVTSTQIVDQVSMNVQNAAGANSSQLSYTYRFSLGNTSFTKDYSSTAQSYNFHTSHVTDLTGTKQVDYPCGISLSAGQWFLGYGRSTTFATQNAAISVATRLNISYDSQFILSQNTLGAIGTLGGATNSSVAFAQLGLGSFSTGGAAGTTNSLNISVISSGASNQIPVFQLVRIA